MLQLRQQNQHNAASRSAANGMQLVLRKRTQAHGASPLGRCLCLASCCMCYSRALLSPCHTAVQAHTRSRHTHASSWQACSYRAACLFHQLLLQFMVTAVVTCPAAAADPKPFVCLLWHASCLPDANQLLLSLYNMNHTVNCCRACAALVYTC